MGKDKIGMTMTSRPARTALYVSVYRRRMFAIRAYSRAPYRASISRHVMAMSRGPDVHRSHFSCEKVGLGPVLRSGRYKPLRPAPSPTSSRPPAYAKIRPEEGAQFGVRGYRYGARLLWVLDSGPDGSLDVGVQLRNHEASAEDALGVP